MDLFQALPALRSHPLLSGKTVALVGVSTVVDDGMAHYFEVGKPKYWQRSGAEGEQTTPPPNPTLRPVLTARAFQLLVRAGYV